MNRTVIYIVLALLLCAVSPLIAQIDTVHLMLDDNIGIRGNTYAYPVRCLDSLTAPDSVYSGEFTVSHNNTVIDVIGVDTAGTLLGTSSNLNYNAVTRKAAFARSQALTGKGVLFYLLIKIKSPSTGTTPVTLINGMINEGNPWDPVLSVDGGTMRPMDIFINPKNPPQDRVVGDTIAFSVTGDVMLPVTWSVSDTHVVSIDGTGKVIGKNVGQTTVSVTDAQGLTDQSGMMPVHPASLRSFQMTVRDTSVMQNLVFDLPIYVSDVSSLGIISAQFLLSFNSSILTPLSVSNQGTLSQSWTPQANITPGAVTVAMSGSTPLSGSGVLLFVRFKVNRFAVSSTTLNLTNVMFNENITAAIDNGVFSPITGPQVTVTGLTSSMIGNESKQLTASGGTAPYRWKVLPDTNIARIDSVSGILLTKKSGFVKVTATDLNGFDGADSMYVNDVRAIFPDTAFFVSDSIDVPVFVSPLNGLSVFSGQIRFAYDTVKLKLLGVQQSSTLTNGSTLEFRDSAGLVSIGFSSGFAISGSGILLKLRFTATGLLSAGFDQILSAQTFFFNETGPTYRYVTQVSGMLRVRSPLNSPPVFTQKLRDTTIAENQMLAFQLTAADADGDSLTFSVLNPPSGMNCTNKGFISWTPSFVQAGIYKVYFDVGDFHVNGVVQDSAVITVTDVNRPPVFTRVFGDTTINEDQQLTFDINAADPDGDIVRYFISNIQAGMNIDTNSGVFNWRPSFNQSGIYTVSQVLNDGKGGIVTKPVIITVNNVNRTPFFTRTMNDTLISAGQSLAFTYLGTDPDNTAPVFNLISGPVGASVSAAGNFLWTPGEDQSGLFPIVVGLSDGIVLVRDTAIVSVQPGNLPPVFTHVLSDTTIKENIPFVFTYQAADPESDTLEWMVISVPPVGLTVSPSGTLQWTPSFDQSGIYTVIVGVRDQFHSLRDTAVITVENFNRSPFFIMTMPDIPLGIDSTISFAYTAGDPDNDSLIFQLVKGRGSAQIAPTGLFTWTPLPADIGRDTFIISVSDGNISVRDTAVIDVFGFPEVTVSQMQFDFGSLTVGTKRTITGTIGNSGDIPLQLRTFQPASVSEHFTFDSSAIMNIPVGGQRTFTIFYSPLTSGAHEAFFPFITNDPRMPLLTVAANGLSVGNAAFRKKILIDNAHQNHLSLNDTVSGISPLFKFLRQSGIALTLSDTALHPQGFDALLLITPFQPYTGGDVERIRRFVNDGGLLVAIGEANSTANGFLNALLNDSLMNTGLTINANRVTDTESNEFLNSGLVILTDFVDPGHPFFSNVDTLLFANSASISIHGKAVPFIRTGPSGRASVVADSLQPAVAGLSVVGKGRVLAAGSIDAWRINLLHQANGINTGILAKDNLQFAMNVFTVTEEYEVKLPAPTVNERYQFVSIPFDLDNSSIASVLKDLGGINPLVWRLFGKFNPAIGRYAEFPGAGFNSFKRGEAYWLITRGAFSLNFGNATIVPAQDFYPIKIGPGYSMIGNPFPYKVSWKESRIGDSVQTILWKFDGSSFQPESLAMEPFFGYFVKNLSHDSVTIYINPADITAGSISKTGIASQYGEEEWRVSISAASGKSRDDFNYAGVARQANDELDRFDISEPPNTPTDYVIVRFSNPLWKKNNGSYAVDIRPIAGEGQFWDADVITAKPKSKVTLSLEMLGNMPPEFRLYLIDKRLERAVEVAASGTYEFTMEKNETHRQFRLMAGRDQFIEQHTGGVPLVARHFALQQNYPNPFNPATVIRYALGNSGDVSISIYNVLGQKVRSLTNEFQSIGSYEVEWDAKDELGVSVASGVYFYKIVVHSNGERVFAETKKMVLMK